LSNEESEDEVIGVETGLKLDSEKKERKKRKKSTKKEVRVRKVQFENKEKKGERRQEKVNKLTKKLLQLNVKDNVYTAAYTQLFVLVSEITDNLPLPTHFAASTVTATSTAGAPTYLRYS